MAEKVERSITVRVTEEQYAVLDGEARRTGVTFSEQVRGILDAAVAKLAVVRYRVVRSQPDKVYIGELLRSHYGDADSAVWEVIALGSQRQRVRGSDQLTMSFTAKSIKSGVTATKFSAEMDVVEVIV